MSKTVKKVAKIALPIIGTIIAPGIGTALGSALSGAALAGIGGAIGGGLGGAIGGGGIKGIATGAALGGVGGYVGGGGLGNVAGSSLATTTGNAALQGPTAGTGLLGSITKSGIGSSLARSLPSVGGASTFNPGSIALGIGNQLIAGDQAEAAEEAARIQAASADRAIAAGQQAQQQQQQTLQPFVDQGTGAIGRLNEINADRAGFIQNNPLYNNLAADAERRLLANQAAKGKVGSGGTAAALQQQLLGIGNNLVNQEVNQLQNQIGTGQNAAVGVGSGQLQAGQNTGNLLTQQGNAQAAGEVGSSNALASGYQNQINTLLALQSLNRTPTYQQINA